MELNLEQLPVSRELEEDVGQEEARRFALSAGDDYELCFTAAADAADTIAKIADETGVAITRIGVVKEGSGMRVIDATGGEVDASGYRHF